MNKLRDLLGSPPEPEPRGSRWLWVGVALATIAGVAVVVASRGDVAPPTAAPPSSATILTTSTTLAVPPSPRVFHEMAYDAESQQMILFGGAELLATGQAGEVIAETWSYDAAIARWSDETSSPQPPGRTGPALAYDGAARLIVLFGGGSTPRICGVSGPCATEAFGDTWVYDAATSTWTQRQPSPAPDARYGAAMAYDAESATLVLFGGGRRSGSAFVNDVYGDTWVYDAAADAWTELNPTVSPPARAWHDMVYDPGLDRILMFGGGAPGMIDDLLWAFDTNTNSWEPFSGTGPTPRWGGVLAFDEDSRRLVLAGGHGPVVTSLGGGSATQIQFLSDIWAFDPERDTWEPRELLDGPIYWVAAAWDPRSDRVVTFALGATGSYDVESSTWEWHIPAELAP